MRGGGEYLSSISHSEGVSLNSNAVLLRCARNDRNAFTLAEVLITLGIIGIVAALILPSLINKKQEKENIAKLEKAYSVISQAFNLAIAENGTVDQWTNANNYAGMTVDINNIIYPYLNVVKDCEKNIVSKCMQTVYGNWGANANLSFANSRSYLLKDGMAVSIIAGSGDAFPERACKAKVSAVNNASYFGYCALIYVDINGIAKPNRAGKDLFAFKLFKDGIAPTGRQSDTVLTEAFSNCLNGSGLYCTAWALINKNMDYLRCNDLDWNTKTKCK